MLRVPPVPPDQRPGLTTAQAPLHVHLKSRWVIMPDGHACQQHPKRPKVQATSHLDVTVSWQHAVKPASRHKCRPPVRGVAAVDIRRARHVRGVAVGDVPRAERLKVVDEITELGVEIRAVMPDDPATECDVMRIGRETSQQARQPGGGRERVVIKECDYWRLSALKPDVAGACYAESARQQDRLIGWLIANPVVTAAPIKYQNDLRLQQRMLS